MFLKKFLQNKKTDQLTNTRHDCGRHSNQFVK